MTTMIERCAICHCVLNRTPGVYARPTPHGRSHATRHHYVAERFFGRSRNRPGTKAEGVFKECPWKLEGKSDLFCYECHEELLHNPVFLPEQIRGFAELCARRGLSEDEKSNDRTALAGRIRLLQEVIARGLDVVLAAEPNDA